MAHLGKKRLHYGKSKWECWSKNLGKTWPSWTSTNQGLFCCHPVSYVAVKLVQVEKQALHLPDTVSVKNILTYFVCATLIFTTITASFDFFYYWFTLSCSIQIHNITFNGKIILWSTHHSPARWHLVKMGNFCFSLSCVLLPTKHGIYMGITYWTQPLSLLQPWHWSGFTWM